MNFKFLSDRELVSRLKAKVEEERKLLMEVLHLLREVESRQLHLAMAYPDLYTFAIQELGYTSGAAYRRIMAMRLLKSVPEAEVALSTGELGLENASQAQSFFRKEDQKRKENGEAKLTPQEKLEVVQELIGKSTREGQRVLMERSSEVMTPTEKLRPLPEQKTLVQFVANAVLMEKLEELKNLLAHQNFEGRMDVLVEKLADIALKKLKPGHKNEDPAAKTIPEVKPTQARKAESPKTPAQGLVSYMNESSPEKKRSRYIRVEVKRRLRRRDLNGCTYKDPLTGRICGSKHGIQFDHSVVPFSQGGANTVENLSLRCGAHNRYLAEQAGLGRPK